MTRLSLLRPMLEVRDVDASVAFYTDALGFSVIASIDDEADPGAKVWASLEKDAVRLMVTRLHTHDDEGTPDHDHDHPHDPTLTGALYFTVDDVDALALDLGGKVQLDYGPVDQPYGMRDLGVSDPDGYFLQFGTPIDEP
jgi:catechol 2,3-dioxygenase-like lactoylglutathione lyase family enzyme